MNRLKSVFFVLSLLLIGIFIHSLTALANGSFGGEVVAKQESASSGPLYGTGWIEKPYTYAIHSPWDLDKSERYQYIAETKEHRFWIYRKDKPFNETSDTSPRCEIRIKNNYTSGNHQFEADYYFVEGSDRPCVMQVWLGFQLLLSKENGGSLYCWKYDDELINNIYGRWIHVNVVHMMDEGDISKGGIVHVYLDGILVSSVDANMTGEDNYFKCGVYTSRSEKSEVWVRNIKIYEQSNETSIEKKQVKFDDIVRLNSGKLLVETTADTIVDIYDVQGRKLLSTQEKEINIERHGTFIIKVSGNDFTVTKKIVN